jgi:uncharacterized protein with ATP-grasp and redox domains
MSIHMSILLHLQILDSSSQHDLYTEYKRKCTEARRMTDEIRSLSESRNEVFSVMCFMTFVAIIYIIIDTAYRWASKFF